MLRELSSDAELHKSFETWSKYREKFNKDLHNPQSDAVAQKWQKDYFQGGAPDGRRAPEHQTRLELRPFLPPKT